MPTVFVGRLRELDSVAEVAAEAAGGVLRLVNVTGEPGVGKTALAERVAANLAGTGWSVAWGRAWNSEVAPPYWIWSQLLAAVEHATGASARVDPVVLAWLREVHPDLGGSVAATRPRLAADAARAALLRSLVAFIRAAAATRPLLLVLDDVHDADQASATLAVALIRGLCDCRVLMLTTQRPGAVRVGALAELDQMGRGLVVPPFDRAEVATFVAARQPVAVVDAQRLHRDSGGNPFLLTHLLSGAATGGPIAARLAGWLATLDPDAGRVVTVAAVVGDRVAVDLLAAAAQLPPDRFLDACARAEAAGVLRMLQPPATGYRFVHALLREAAYRQIPQLDRCRLHLRVAEGIRHTAPRHGRDAALAHHLRAALPVGDVGQAVAATLAAARVALQVFAGESAVDACTAGLAAIAPCTDSALAEPAVRWRAELLTVLGAAQECVGDPEAARRSLLDAIELATRAGDRVLAAEATLALPRRQPFLRPEPELRDHLRAAVRRLGDAAPALRVRLLARLLSVFGTGTDLMRGEVGDERKERCALAREALAGARRLGEPGLLAQTLSAWLFATWAPDTVDDRLASSEEIIELALGVGDLRSELDGRRWRFTALLELGRVTEAEAELARYEKQARHSGHPGFLMFAHSRRSTLAALRGRLAEAEKLAREAHQLARAAGEPDAEYLLGAQLAPHAHWLGGRYVTDLLDRMTALQGAPLFLAILLALAGRPDEAREPLRAAVAGIDAVPGAVRLFALGGLGEAAYLLGDADAATAARAGLIPYADRYLVGSRATGCWGAAARLLGQCAIVLGALDEAVRWLRRGITLDRQLGAVALVAAGQAALAEALLRRHGPADVDEAQRLLAEASVTAAVLDAPGLGARVHRAAAAQPVDRPAGHGAQTARPGCDGLDADGPRFDGPGFDGPDADPPRLRRDGEGWRLCYRSRDGYLRPSKGLAQLAVLLANPGQEITSTELAGGPAAPPTPVPVLDDAAKRAYRRRLAELDDALRRSDDRGDAAAARAIARERRAIVAELKRASGLGGRTRRFSDDAERARINVTRTIRQALDQILAVDPDAGAHLCAAVRTGHRCSYDPDDERIRSLRSNASVV